ncbi:MAG: SiaB family protein kinase [Cytophagales bacterium]
MSNNENPLSHIQKLHDDLFSNHIILVYVGEFTQEITKSVLAMAEKNMETLNEESTIKKKVFNVMVECLQNICKHSEEFSPESTIFNTAIFMIGKQNNVYTVATGNMLYNDRVDNLKSKLDRINSLDKDGLKELYKEALTNSELSDKGGAGLGFIDMARKSGQKLEYGFSKVNEEYSFFSFQTKILRVKEA